VIIVQQGRSGYLTCIQFQRWDISVHNWITFYNYLARNPYEISKEAKVKRALQLLRDHFDIVVVGDHDRFEKELLSITKWEKKTMNRHNTGGDTPFNKSDVELIQRLLQDNGDIDFIYKVRDIYEA